jgi:3',5'-cyclic AMP phosphodiesterase CpdA
LPLRVLHFSDIHLPFPLRRIPLLDWPGKRLLGVANLFVGRGRQFRDAPRKIGALDRLRREEAIDLVICTGDYTALGSSAELEAARRAVDPLTKAPYGYLTVPGNHDVYTLGGARRDLFGRHFGDLLASDMPAEAAAGTPWPLVRLVGDDVAVVAVNGARPNPWPSLSSGKIPGGQMTALGEILRDDRIRSRFVFVLSHYAPRRAGGRPDRWHHGLVNAEALLEACSALERGAVLCGHLHETFLVRVPGFRVPVLCAGSATMEGGEGLWSIEVGSGGASATPWAWQGDGYRSLDGERVTL